MNTLDGARTGVRVDRQSCGEGGPDDARCDQVHLFLHIALADQRLVCDVGVPLGERKELPLEGGAGTATEISVTHPRVPNRRVNMYEYV